MARIGTPIKALAVEDATITTGSVKDSSDVVHARLEIDGLCHAIGETDAALVQAYDACEAS